MNWTEIILGVLTFLGVVYGGWTTVYLRKEQKRSAKLDNDNKVADSWRQLYEKALEAKNEVREEALSDKSRYYDALEKNDELHAALSRLREEKDAVSTQCAVAEILVCKEINCALRNPPLGSQAFATEFAKQAAERLDEISGNEEDV